MFTKFKTFFGKIKLIYQIVFKFFILQLPIFIQHVFWCFLLFTFPHIHATGEATLKVLYPIYVCLLFFSLSGVFVLMPSATGNLFGMTNLAVNYGLVYAAFVSFIYDCFENKTNIIFYQQFLIVI